MRREPAILPCPFCRHAAQVPSLYTPGDKPRKFVRVLDIFGSGIFNKNDIPRYCVLCEKCQAQGPMRLTVVSAINAWNRAKREVRCPIKFTKVGA